MSLKQELAAQYPVKKENFQIKAGTPVVVVTGLDKWKSALLTAILACIIFAPFMTKMLDGVSRKVLGESYGILDSENKLTLIGLALMGAVFLLALRLLMR